MFRPYTHPHHASFESLLCLFNARYDVELPQWDKGDFWAVILKKVNFWTKMWFLSRQYFWHLRFKLHPSRQVLDLWEIHETHNKRLKIAFNTVSIGDTETKCVFFSNRCFWKLNENEIVDLYSGNPCLCIKYTFITWINMYPYLSYSLELLDWAGGMF